MTQTTTFAPQTYVYKTVGALPIHADVYRAPGDEVRPAIFWVHGGAMISGSRTHIPAEQVEKVHTAHPEVQIYWYENAGHGFNCDMRSSYNPDAAAVARTRALAFLSKHLA